MNNKYELYANKECVEPLFELLQREEPVYDRYDGFEYFTAYENVVLTNEEVILIKLAFASKEVTICQNRKNV